MSRTRRPIIERGRHVQPRGFQLRGDEERPQLHQRSEKQKQQIHQKWRHQWRPEQIRNDHKGPEWQRILQRARFNQ